MNGVEDHQRCTHFVFFIALCFHCSCDEGMGGSSTGGGAVWHRGGGLVQGEGVWHRGRGSSTGGGGLAQGMGVWDRGGGPVQGEEGLAQGEGVLIFQSVDRHTHECNWFSSR